MEAIMWQVVEVATMQQPTEPKGSGLGGSCASQIARHVMHLLMQTLPMYTTKCVYLQEDEAIEAATRQAVVRELQRRAAAEVTHRAAAKQAAVHWLQAPLQRADLEYVHENIRILKDRLARADAAWQTEHAAQACKSSDISGLAAGAAAAAVAAAPAAMHPTDGAQAAAEAGAGVAGAAQHALQSSSTEHVRPVSGASHAPLEGPQDRDGAAVRSDAGGTAERASETASKAPLAGSSKAGPSRLARVTHASTLLDDGDSTVLGQTSVAAKSPAASVPMHSADSSADAVPPAAIVQQTMSQQMSWQAPYMQQAAGQHPLLEQQQPQRRYPERMHSGFAIVELSEALDALRELASQHMTVRMLHATGLLQLMEDLQSHRVSSVLRNG